MKHLFFLAAGLIALSACATTKTSSGEGATTAESGETKPVCRSVKVAGSNIPEKVCS